MLAAALFANIEEACTAVLILTEGIEVEHLIRSRITRAEVLRQLRVVATSLNDLPAATRSQLAELDWQGWAAAARNFDQPPEVSGDALWFAVRSLVPATLMWLKVYRQSQPDLFAITKLD